MNNICFEDRVRGLVFGTAYGDALGAVVEKLPYEEIKEKFGRVESIHFPWWKDELPKEMRLNRKRGYGIVTDDTLMTLALINVYNKNQRHIDAYDMANDYVKEIAFYPRYIPEFGKEALIIDRLFYPEKYIFHRHTLANCQPREGGIGNMINCGAAMYIAPIGAVNACNPKAAYDEAISFAMGHQSSYGLEAAGVLAACVSKAFEPDVTIDTIVETALNLAKDGTRTAIEEIYKKAKELKDKKDDKDLVVKEFHDVMLKYSPMGDDVFRSIEKVGQPSNHYTPNRLFSIEELPIALGYCTLHDGNFKVAIIDGINSGRDTDSIGVMIGVILGVMQGVQVISKEDRKTLEKVNKQELLKSADRFAESAMAIINEDIKAAKQRESLLNSINLM